MIDSGWHHRRVRRQHHRWRPSSGGSSPGNPTTTVAEDLSPTTLVHHFGTKEQMLEAILGRLRERVFVATRDAAGESPDLATKARASWTRAADPDHAAEFRLFFAVYGRALQAPEQFAAVATLQHPALPSVMRPFTRTTGIPRR